MKGNIYTREKCFICNGKLKHDDRRRGCFCPEHPQIAAVSKFYVQFGRGLQKNFKDYRDAERFLIGLRYETDKGSFDIRDYRVDNPLGFRTLAEKWLAQKSRTKIESKTVQGYRNFMDRAVNAWGDTNIKLIGTAEIEDFIFDDHRVRTRPCKSADPKKKPKPISDKTRANIKSCLHDFWTWVVRREKKGGRHTIEMPDFPEVDFELEYRNVVEIETQAEIIEEVKRISYDFNPKIWLGIKLLSTYIKIRPGEMRNVLEKHIRLDAGFIVIPHPKEKKPKYAYLDAEDINLIKSMPQGLPNMYFFRHGLRGSGIKKPGGQFGPKYFKVWWDRACHNLGIHDVDLYGGTKHSTAVALGKVLTPEQIKRGGTGHATNKAFERYLMPDKAEGLTVTKAVKKLRRPQKAEVVEIKKAREKKGPVL
jgi:integrase